MHALIVWWKKKSHGIARLYMYCEKQQIWILSRVYKEHLFWHSCSCLAGCSHKIRGVASVMEAPIQSTAADCVTNRSSSLSLSMQNISQPRNKDFKMHLPSILPISKATKSICPTQSNRRSCTIQWAGYSILLAVLEVMCFTWHLTLIQKRRVVLYLLRRGPVVPLYQRPLVSPCISGQWTSAS